MNRKQRKMIERLILLFLLFFIFTFVLISDTIEINIVLYMLMLLLSFCLYECDWEVYMKSTKYDERTRYLNAIVISIIIEYSKDTIEY